jgi:hypothetical protein
MHLEDPRVAGSDEPLVEWVDRDPVTDEPLRKDWIRHPVERDNDPGDRRD